MDHRKLTVRRVAVLGAGVMGAQIAAHCANADIPVLLFDLAAREGQPNSLIDKALANLRKLEPAPFSDPNRASAIQAANYEQDLERLGECDLVIEAIAERMDWKRDLYLKIAPHIAPDAVIASNTSGLSITALAENLPEAMRDRFCGVHFFNPPRYMSLLELIPTRDTDAALLDRLEAWFTTRLGKNVLRAKDTPNFIANRVGVFSMLAVMHHTARLGLGFDEVDALTGPRIGRAKSATYRTADVVGLDTMAHVIGTMETSLSDPAIDPWCAYYRKPDWLNALIAKGALGQKTRAGVFRKVGKEIQVLDLKAQDYRPSAGEIAPEVAAILAQKDAALRFTQMRASSHPQAQFLWAIFRDIFHYCAWHLGTIADTSQEIDCALRWGFGWSQGPFETWQSAGWRSLAGAIAEDIAAGRAMSSAPLPAWVKDVEAAHTPEGSWAPRLGSWKPRSSLPVYARQLQPERLLGEAPASRGETVWENGDPRDGVRLWTLPAVDPRIGILSFKSKMHSASAAVLDGIIGAIGYAERELDGVVIWHEAPFAVGANLKEVLEGCKAGQFALLDRMIARFQQASQSLRYAQVPTVAAVQGLALGGGCEFVMHAQHRVFALESYVGLVEAGVGVIPAGGGCKFLAVRAHELAATTAGGDVFPFLQNVFQNVAMATVSKSAHQAIALGYGKASDDVLFNPHELLFVAIRRARAAAEAAARPVLPGRDIVVAGRNGIAACEMLLLNMREGGMISAYDYKVARAAAVALCGGEVETGTRVDEQWLLDVERTLFIDLLREEKTQQRIAHMLETGKPLRN